MFSLSLSKLPKRYILPAFPIYTSTGPRLSRRQQGRKARSDDSSIGHHGACAKGGKFQHQLCHMGNLNVLNVVVYK